MSKLQISKLQISPERLARFWSSSRAVPNLSMGAECWVWQLCLTADGYGRVTIGGHQDLAHRVAYTLAKGPIPSRFTLDHLCRVRASDTLFLEG